MEELGVRRLECDWVFLPMLSQGLSVWPLCMGYLELPPNMAAQSSWPTYIKTGVFKRITTYDLHLESHALSLPLYIGQDSRQRLSSFQGT